MGLFFLSFCNSFTLLANKYLLTYSQFGRESAFFLVIFGKLLRACFIVPGPAKLKIVRVRSVLNDVSVPFASCPPNWRHSGYYSCQTGSVLIDVSVPFASCPPNWRHSEYYSCQTVSAKRNKMSKFQVRKNSQNDQTHVAGKVVTMQKY